MTITVTCTTALVLTNCPAALNAACGLYAVAAAATCGGQPLYTGPASYAITWAPVQGAWQLGVPDARGGCVNASRAGASLQAVPPGSSIITTAAPWRLGSGGGNTSTMVAVGAAIPGCALNSTAALYAFAPPSPYDDDEGGSSASRVRSLSRQQVIIIVAAAGGGSLLLVCCCVVYCCWWKKRSPRARSSGPNKAASSSSDDEVEEEDAEDESDGSGEESEPEQPQQRHGARISRREALQAHARISQPHRPPPPPPPPPAGELPLGQRGLVAQLSRMPLLAGLQLPAAQREYVERTLRSAGDAAWVAGWSDENFRGWMHVVEMHVQCTAEQRHRLVRELPQFGHVTPDDRLFSMLSFGEAHSFLLRRQRQLMEQQRQQLQAGSFAAAYPPRQYAR